MNKNATLPKASVCFDYYVKDPLTKSYGKKTENSNGIRVPPS